MRNASPSSPDLLSELHRAVCIGEDCLTSRAARTEERVKTLEAHVYATDSSPPPGMSKRAAIGGGVAATIGAAIVAIAKAAGWL